MPWPQTGATNYHEQLGLPEKGRAINGLFVFGNKESLVHYFIITYMEIKVLMVRKLLSLKFLLIFVSFFSNLVPKQMITVILLCFHFKPLIFIQTYVFTYNITHIHIFTHNTRFTYSHTTHATQTLTHTIIHIFTHTRTHIHSHTPTITHIQTFLIKYSLSNINTLTFRFFMHIDIFYRIIYMPIEKETRMTTSISGDDRIKLLKIWLSEIAQDSNFFTISKVNYSKVAF